MEAHPNTDTAGVKYCTLRKQRCEDTKTPDQVLFSTLETCKFPGGSKQGFCKVPRQFLQDWNGVRARFGRSICKVPRAKARQPRKVRTTSRQKEGRSARNVPSAPLFHQTVRFPSEVFHCATQAEPAFPAKRAGTDEQTAACEDHTNPNSASKRSQIPCSGSSTTGSSCVGASMGSVDMTNCTSVTPVFFELAKLTGLKSLLS